MASSRYKRLAAKRRIVEKSPFALLPATLLAEIAEYLPQYCCTSAFQFRRIVLIPFPHLRVQCGIAKWDDGCGSLFSLLEFLYVNPGWKVMCIQNIVELELRFVRNNISVALTRVAGLLRNLLRWEHIARIKLSGLGDLTAPVIQLLASVSSASNHGDRLYVDVSSGTTRRWKYAPSLVSFLWIKKLDLVAPRKQSREASFVELALYCTSVEELLVSEFTMESVHYLLNSLAREKPKRLKFFACSETRPTVLEHRPRCAGSEFFVENSQGQNILDENTRFKNPWAGLLGLPSLESLSLGQQSTVCWMSSDMLPWSVPTKLKSLCIDLRRVDADRSVLALEVIESAGDCRLPCLEALNVRIDLLELKKLAAYVRAITTLKKLVVDVRGRGATSESFEDTWAVEVFAIGLQQLKSLTTLHLHVSKLNHHFTQISFEAIQSLTDLRVCCTATLGTKEFVATSFGDMMKELPSLLCKLDLSHWPIGAEGGRLIAMHVLKESKCISELRLRSCRLQNTGVLHIMNVLHLCPSLKKLDVSYNHLRCSHRLWKGIFQSLMSSLWLEDIELGWLSEPEVEILDALADYLLAATNLRSIDVYLFVGSTARNAFQEKLRGRVLPALAKNETVTYFDIGGIFDESVDDDVFIGELRAALRKSSVSHVGLFRW